ncbi:MAG: hypothetical protein QOF51_1170 [Chloroflexota bacterium]|jgi:DNA-binding transcriptional MerR regulator|nr:hypothetical protein [Chloroflexota bacterium]
MTQMYRVGEFAALTGVSVRTLHHYDQIGLLRPAAHTEGGQRLYAAEDLLTLQQILTLRYLGFPLKEIGGLLERPDFDLVGSMQIQRNVLRDHISELERVEAALAELLDQRTATGRWAWDLVVKASATVQDGLARGESMDNQFSPEIMKQWEELGKQVGPEEIAAVERDWAQLLGEVRANRDLDPASPEAQALGDRWTAMVQRTFRGNQFLMEATRKGYEEGRWKDQPGAVQSDDAAFIERVRAARSAK